jgi:hypothetical protein
MPLHGPLWQIWFQEKFEEDGKTKGLLFFKINHTLAMESQLFLFLLATSKEFEWSYFIPLPNAKYWQIILIKLSVIFIIPKLVFNSLLQAADDKIFTRIKLTYSGLVIKVLECFKLICCIAGLDYTV